MPLLCALASISIAALSVIGWVSGVEYLTSVSPGLPRLVPMTAGMILLASATIWRQWHARAHRGRAGIAPAATLALAAGLLALCHAMDWIPASAAGPWRVSSPVTASLFTTLGLSLLCMQAPGWVCRGQWLALGALLVAMLTAAAFSFRDTFLFELLPGKGTSVLTTLSVLLLSVGVLALRPTEGIMVAVTGPGSGAWFARRLLGSALAMPILLGLVAALALHFQLADPVTLITFIVWGMIVLFTAVVWRLALRLHWIEAARRTAETEREQAIEALRMADARKDEFLAMLAHELRNPLAPIRTGAELLRMTHGADAQLRRTSEIIARQADHMTHLVDDLLDVSRVTRGLITLEQAPVDAHLAVCDAVEQARPMMARRGHHLHTELGRHHPRVLGDHKRLVQVVANLLNNAAKYTPPGGEVEVCLRTGVREVEIEVRDNGIGIDAGLLPHVFEIFTQATRTAGREEGGLGLGLALVKRLAELHGGEVRASSAGKGQGSSFVITLPRMPESLPSAPAPDTVDAPARS